MLFRNRFVIVIQQGGFCIPVMCFPESGSQGKNPYKDMEEF